MNMNDAINILGINETSITSNVLKKYYRAACLKYHPDHNPAGEEMMKMINCARERLEQEVLPIILSNNEFNYNYGEEINDALNKIKNLKGLLIEICGAWVWVSGESRKHKENLKNAGFKFSGPKKIWYFRPNNQSKKWHSNSMDMESIRQKYGSKKISCSIQYLNKGLH